MTMTLGRLFSSPLLRQVNETGQSESVTQEISHVGDAELTSCHACLVCPTLTVRATAFVQPLQRLLRDTWAVLVGAVGVAGGGQGNADRQQDQGAPFKNTMIVCSFGDWRLHTFLLSLAAPEPRFHSRGFALVVASTGIACRGEPTLSALVRPVNVLVLQLDDT